MKYRFVVFSFFIAALTLHFNACEDSKSRSLPSSADDRNTAPQVTDGGKTIKLDMSLTDQIASVPVEKKNLKVDIKAPCRVSASAMVSTAGGAPVLFFETSDISDAYSDFQRNKSQMEKSEKQVARLKALVEHEAAAGKDLSDAQSDRSTEDIARTIRE